MEQKFTGRVTLILAIIVVMVFAFFPQKGGWGGGILPLPKLLNGDIPWSRKHNLKPGLDIRGGTSLLYEIEAPPGRVGDEGLAQQVADSLKKRVDPDGVRNLIWRPTGGNRLEIQMPLGENAEEAAKYRQEFSRAQQALANTNIRPAEVYAAFEMANEAERTRRLEQLALGSPRRVELFEKMRAAREALKAAETSGDPVKKVDARDELTALENELEKTNLPVPQLQVRILETAESQKEKAQSQRKSKLAEEANQHREAELRALREQFKDFPARLAAIDTFVKAFDDYAKFRGTVDDAEGLKRLLRGSGVLEFHIGVTEFGNSGDGPIAQAMRTRLRTEGPTPKPGDIMRWYEVDQEEAVKGRPTETIGGKQYILLYTTPEYSLVPNEKNPWGLEGASRDTDPGSGRAVVAFRFDTNGGMLFGDLTGRNVNKPLAIVLDNKVISAPNINQRIDGSGIIQGDFTDPELDYLIRTLNAGSLPAKLADNPISERTVSPTLGHDNLVRGFLASVIGLVVVAIFLIGYYYKAGVVATFAVLMNMIVILGMMAMFDATFTLPGIAAMVLTVGMAVDANVLIFERLREEQHRGLSLRLALHNAYDRAWSAILDSNVTTAITSLVLYYFGSEEVKGFGLTLLIGIVSSLFTALFVTRTIFDIWIEKFGLKRLGSLPLTFPNWDNALRPNIDWMSKAWIFYVFSTVFILAGLSAFWVKGRNMFDTEFVGGTAVQVEFKADTELEQVRSLLATYDKPGQLPSPQVVSLGDSKKDYEILTPNDKADDVRAAVLAALKDRLTVTVPSQFNSAKVEFEQLPAGVVVPVQSGVEGSNLSDVGFTPSSVAAHEGGVAIKLMNLDPPLSANEIAERVNRARLRDNLPYRAMEVDTGRAANEPAKNALVIVSDPQLAYSADDADKAERWREGLAQPLWKLVTGAISEPPSLQKVTNFSPQVAQATMADAILALVISIVLIMIYIWVRFGNLKYGTATVVALLHDTLIVIGAVGISHYIADTVLGKPLLIESFRINLTLVAAVLTVMGYSMNDTIVVFDRIRENRGKYGYVSRQVINDSINQTLSRTLLTGGTTIVTVFVMYIWGGPGIHGFTFALLVGIVVGTYSSIAIAAPILLLGGKSATANAEGAPAAAGPKGQLQRVGR